MSYPLPFRMPATVAPVHVDLDLRPSYLAAALTALAVLVLYLITLSPSTAMWDASEYIAAAKVLGIPHPPGNPFFVLIGNVFGRLPLPMSYAARINILAALASALSAGAWFLITERVLAHWLPARWQRILGGCVAALIGATAFTVWNQSVVNEKVYTISLFFFAAVSWLMVRWADDPDGPVADRLLVLVAYLLGLGYANHPAGFLAGPAVAAAVLMRRWQTVLRWRLLLAAAGALVLGMSPFISQPIRASHFPAINEGEPTGCRDRIAADCILNKVGRERFMYNFNREQYGKPALGERQAPLTAQVGMWWLYFRWQWLRDAHNEHPGMQAALAVIFLALGALGGYVHWRRDRQSFAFFGPLMFTITAVLIYYMNFKYGASQASGLEDVEREVRDRDYFYLWSYSAWSVWAALGLVFVWEWLASLVGADTVRVGRDTVYTPRRNSWAMASPVLALALLPLVGNWKQASRAGHTDTADFASDLLNSVEPYGVLVTVGDNDTFPLWYAQEVEGVRPDVVVANTSLLNTDWYVRQLIRRPVYEYDAAKGPAIYRSASWPKPKGPPLAMTLEEADKVPMYVPLNEAQIFRKDQIVATIQPRMLTKADILVLRMIRDAYPERPFFIARTSGRYGSELGLEPYLLTQGLAQKLLPTVPTPGPDTLLVPGEGWVDVKRTRTLWNDVFKGQAALIKRGDWVDRPSQGIPFLYVGLGAILGEALQRNGELAAAEEVYKTTEGVARATRLTELLSQVRPQPAPMPLTGDSQRTLPLPPR